MKPNGLIKTKLQAKNQSSKHLERVNDFWYNIGCLQANILCNRDLPLESSII